MHAPTASHYEPDFWEHNGRPAMAGSSILAQKQRLPQWHIFMHYSATRHSPITTYPPDTRISPKDKTLQGCRAEKLIRHCCSSAARIEIVSQVAKWRETAGHKASAFHIVPGTYATVWTGDSPETHSPLHPPPRHRRADLRHHPHRRHLSHQKLPWLLCS